MVKLPISDYVADYYKEQGIEFTFRQQAHFCWYYNDLLKEKMKSLNEILKISNDEKLNTEIRERIAYEEKAYQKKSIMMIRKMSTGIYHGTHLHMGEISYIVHPMNVRCHLMRRINPV